MILKTLKVLSLVVMFVSVSIFEFRQYSEIKALKAKMLASNDYPSKYLVSIKSNDESQIDDYFIPVSFMEMKIDRETSDYKGTLYLPIYGNLSEIQEFGLKKAIKDEVPESN